MTTLEEKLNDLKQRFTEIISLLYIPSTQKNIVIPTIYASLFTDERVDITKDIIKQYHNDIDDIVKLSGVIGIVKLIRQFFGIRLSQKDISVILKEIIDPFEPSKESSQMYLNTFENFKEIADFRIMYLITERGLEKQKFNAVIYKEETKELISIDDFLKHCFYSNSILFWFRIIKRESIMALKKILDIADLSQVEIPNYTKNLSLKLIDFEKLITSVPLNWFHPKAQEKINAIIIKNKQEALIKKEEALEEVEKLTEDEEPTWEEEEAKGVLEQEEEEEGEIEFEPPDPAQILKEIKETMDNLDYTNETLSDMLFDLNKGKSEDISTLELRKPSIEERSLIKLHKRELSVIKRYTELHKDLKERITDLKKKINIKKDKITDKEIILYSKKIDKLGYALSVLFKNTQNTFFGLEGGKPFGLSPIESTNAGLSLVAQTLVDLREILADNKNHKNYSKLKDITDEYQRFYIDLKKRTEDIKTANTQTEISKLKNNIKGIVTKLDSQLSEFFEVIA